MNTALARRLALGDRVIWMGKDDCQPSGPGTIIRITAHQVEVLWEGETARRYRQKIQKISFDFFCPPPLLLPCPPTARLLFRVGANFVGTAFRRRRSSVLIASVSVPYQSRGAY